MFSHKNLKLEKGEDIQYSLCYEIRREPIDNKTINGLK